MLFHQSGYFLIRKMNSGGENQPEQIDFHDSGRFPCAVIKICRTYFPTLCFLRYSTVVPSAASAVSMITAHRIGVALSPVWLLPAF